MTKEQRLLDMLCNHIAMGRELKALKIAQHLRDSHGFRCVPGLQTSGYRKWERTNA